MLVEWKQQFAECRDVDVVMDEYWSLKRGSGSKICWKPTKNT